MNMPYTIGYIAGYVIVILIPVFFIRHAVKTGKERRSLNRFYQDYSRNYKKQFEDRFSAIQTKWIELGLEYVPYADKIFVYGSCKNVMYFNVFYIIDNNVVRKHQVNTESGRRCDVSADRQRILLDSGIEELRKMYTLFQEYQRDMPNEIRLVFDVRKRSYEADYSYGQKNISTDIISADHLFDRWYEDTRKQAYK